MKKWGGQLDIRPPHSKNWGGRVPPIPPRIDAPGRSYEITEISRGGGDKKAKIRGRSYKIIEIPRKFLEGLVN